MVADNKSLAKRRGRLAGEGEGVAAQPREHVEALTPVPLMQIATGFWAFKTLAAAHELDLFTRLAGGAETTAQELARELDIEQRPAEMLLTGCASLGLLNAATAATAIRRSASSSSCAAPPTTSAAW